jgi:hypothetical protein
MRTTAAPLHVPDPGLVVAGDVVYSGTHLYLGEGVVVGGVGPWWAAIGMVGTLKPRRIIAGAPEQAGRRRRRADDRGNPAMIERYSKHLARTVLCAGEPVAPTPQQGADMSTMHFTDGQPRSRRTTLVRSTDGFGQVREAWLLVATSEPSASRRRNQWVGRHDEPF